MQIGHEPVAVHANTGGWCSCVPALVCPGVAIEAIDLQIAAVQPVRERDGLLGREALVIAGQIDVNAARIDNCAGYQRNQ
jgi:hypothetical protein